jgi:hypothetical protein
MFQLFTAICVRAAAESIAAFSFPPEKPVLFLVNPKSGPGRAEKIFRQIVEPVLKASLLLRNIIVYLYFIIVSSVGKEFTENANFIGEKRLVFSCKCSFLDLQGQFHEMDLAFDDMFG